jgi:hypothetical protein
VTAPGKKRRQWSPEAIQGLSKTTSKRVIEINASSEHTRAKLQLGNKYSNFLLRSGNDQPIELIARRRKASAATPKGRPFDRKPAGRATAAAITERRQRAYLSAGNKGFRFKKTQH